MEPKYLGFTWDFYLGIRDNVYLPPPLPPRGGAELAALAGKLGIRGPGTPGRPTVTLQLAKGHKDPPFFEGGWAGYVFGGRVSDRL